MQLIISRDNDNTEETKQNNGFKSHRSPLVA